MNEKTVFSQSKKIIFSIISVFVFIFLLELISYFYLFAYSETGTFGSRQINNVFHPFRGWQTPKNSLVKSSKPFFNFPNEVFLETDGNGWIITPINYEKPDIKIAILGGSTVFGVGSTSNATTVPAQLEQKIFDKFGIKAEVTNLGVRAYNSFQELMTLHEYLLTNSLDIVIVLSGHNDAKFGSINDDIRFSLIQREVFDASVPLVRRAQRQQPIIINPEGYLRKNSYFLDVFFRVLYRAVGQPKYYKSKEPNKNINDQSNIQERTEVSVRNYKMMKTLVEHTGAKFVFALQPSIFTWVKFPGNVSYVKENIEYFSEGRKYMTSYFDVLALPTNGLNILDLRAAMDAVEGAPYVDSIHYSDLGAGRLADILSDNIRPLMD